MPRWPDYYPTDGWATRREQVFVQMNGSWLVATGGPTMLLAEAPPYRSWRNWPGELELGTLRPRGCDGRLVAVEDAIAYEAESGLLRAFGATSAHVCCRIHHAPEPAYCWCDSCCNRRRLGLDR